MPIKAFINNQENGIITYKGDTEPCKVYIDGNLVENISYIPQSVEGVNSVEYSSEYKRNIRTMQIDGNTEQYQGTFAPQNITIPTSYVIPSSAPIMVSETPITVPNGARLTLTANKTGNGNISSLSSGFIVIISDSRDDIANNYTKILEDYGTPQYSTPPKVSGEFYIGVANFLPGGIDNPQAYWDFLRANYTFTLSTEGNTVPNPDFPQPIYNANDSGMSLVLSGENLFNAQGERSKTVGSYVYANNSIYRSSIGDGGYMYLIYAKTYKAGTYTISAKGEFNNVNNIGLLTTVNIPNSTYSSYYGAYRSGFVSSSVTERSVTFTTTQDFQIGFSFGGTAGGSGKIYDIMLSTTGGIYKPYTETTIQIPPSVTVGSSTIPLRFAKYKNADYLLIDRTNGTVKYYQYSTVGDQTKPLSEQLENIPPLEYTLYDKSKKITTDLGQALLDLANSTQNATNIITITSTPSVSKLSVNYAKYGGTQ